jgi:hypothetical protein
LEKAARLAKEGFQTPIDEIDAAARILDPIMVGLRPPQRQQRQRPQPANGRGSEAEEGSSDEGDEGQQEQQALRQVLHYGAFFKDYKLTEW